MTTDVTLCIYGQAIILGRPLVRSTGSEVETQCQAKPRKLQVLTKRTLSTQKYVSELRAYCSENFRIRSSVFGVAATTGGGIRKGTLV